MPHTTVFSLTSAGVVAAMTVAVAPAASAATVAPTLRVITTQQIARQDVPPAPGSQPDTEVEPDVQFDPTNANIAVAVAQQGRFATGASVAPGYSWTHDGGRTWHHAALPHLTKATGGTFDRASDPVVAFGADGSVYASTLAFNVTNCRSVIAVQRSTDGGVTFAAPVLEQNSNNCLVFEDKNWITVDDNPASPHYGRIYGPWTHFVYNSSGTQISAAQVLRYSDDHGLTWSGFIEISPFGGDTEGAQPVVLPNGTLVDVYDLYRNHETLSFIAAQVSADGGQTWSAVHVFAQQIGGGVPNQRTGELVSATVDQRTGVVYASWQDSRYRNNGKTDIVLASSPNGWTWSSPVRVNNDPVTDDVFHFTPDVAALGGNVYVSYRSREGAGPFVGMLLSSSGNGGRSFAAPLKLGPASNNTYAAVAPVPFLGDYMGLDATPDGRLYAVWCVASVPPDGGHYHQTLWAATLAVS